MEKKRNFYFKSETDKKDESIEVYIGQSCGKQLSLDIQNAKSEVLIISPYVDETKIDDLIRLQKKGINVKIAFSSLRPEQKRSVLRKLIYQNQTTNITAKEKKEKYEKLLIGFGIALLCLGLYSIYVIFKSHFEKQILNNYSLVAFFSFISCYFIKKGIDKVRKVNIYNYSYTENIKFKYLRSSQEKGMFIHSKIYVIDRKIAYLGSLNFTNNGFNSNFETRVRITKTDSINELIEFINSIFEDDYTFDNNKIWWLGPQVFSEPKY
ncbi:NgoFVII family restriction endonuclease [Flavobacterium psychrophilum]|uniref:phospholipase D-like domain-containing protein n=1 Tax=Flavobacterium psychrophilum TaxID=96345 RepID=UPI001C8F90AE|nr:phospholipase D-like domain-containing protein [Flavobacterium psychrophilum]QZK99476.1 NgoFVII family restriction endonuclease [Flavobacterium psychrophilum]